MRRDLASVVPQTGAKRFWIIASLLALVACSPTIATHGHRIDDAALARIEPGRTSRDQVVALLGSPSSWSTFDETSWYYVSQRTERRSFYEADVVDQQVVTINFDDSGLVREIDRVDLADARSIDPVDRKTPTEGNELSVLEQFIGNVGRFNLPESER